MSYQFFHDDVLFLQRLLSCCGLYTDRLDGDYGPNTHDAEEKFGARSQAIADAEGAFDERSERNIRSLQLLAQPLARRSLKAIRAKAASAGMTAKILSGTRSYAEQNALYKQGRFGNPGPRVTNARGGQSWHNFGLAWDIGLFRDGRYIDADTQYRTVSTAGKVAGVEWGGDWVTFKDPPHYQAASHGRQVSGARAIFEAGGR